MNDQSDSNESLLNTHYKGHNPFFLMVKMNNKGNLLIFLNCQGCKKSDISWTSVKLVANKHL